MYRMLVDDIKTVLLIVLIILLTHTLFFVAYGYLMGGDPLIALRNFYNIMYNIR